MSTPIALVTNALEFAAPPAGSHCDCAGSWPVGSTLPDPAVQALQEPPPPARA